MINGTVTEGDLIIGLGTGMFEYALELPDGIDLSGVTAIEICAELSSGRKATPQTDGYKLSSQVNISVNGIQFGIVTLPNAPADTCGALSYIHGIPGRYGELTRAIGTEEDLAEIFAGVRQMYFAQKWHGRIQIHCPFRAKYICLLYARPRTTY